MLVKGNFDVINMQGKTIKIMHDLLFAQEEGRSFDVF
jgi:hypothetical protein